MNASTVTKKLKNPGDVLFWIFIILILSLQAMGLGFGLPSQYHPDEYFININSFRLFHELRSFDFSPTYYVLGVRWIYFVEYVMIFIIGKALGSFSSFADFYNYYYSFGNPYVDAASPLFYLPPRITSFCFYIGSILLVYQIMRYLFKDDSRIAKIALATACLLPAGYLYSHYGTRESAICFVSLLLIYHAMVLFDPTKLKSIVVAGLLLGASVAVKENAAIFIVLYLCYIFFGKTKNKEISVKRKILFATSIAAIAVIFFLLLNPQRLFINNALDVTRRYIPVSTSIDQFRTSNSHIIYPLAFLHEFSLPGLIILSIGFISSWVLKKELRSIIIIVIASYLVLDLVKANGANKADRFIMNIFLPFLIIGLSGLWCLCTKKVNKKYLLYLPLVIGIWNSQELISSFMAFNKHDTRDIAEKWIENNIPEKSMIAKETIYTPRVNEARYTVVKNEWVLGNYSLDSLRNCGIEYLVINDHFINGWLNNDSVVNRYQSFLPYAIKKIETPWKLKMNNFHSPTIWICKIQ